MKPAPFEFFAPGSLDETLALLDRYGEDARILAGGQSLVPLLNMRVVRPSVLVSINRCADLDYIRLDDGHLVCGALTRQAAAEESDAVRRECPLLAEALPYVGGLANRNRGTVCGSLAHADPLAELPAVALALDAEFEVASARGRRRVAASEFFVAELTSCMEPGEMLEAVRFPRSDPDDVSAFAEVSNRRHGFAVAGMAARLQLAPDGTCRAARLAAIGAGSMALRIAPAEEVLVGSKLEDHVVREAARVAADSVTPPEDIHADPEYRRHVMCVLLARVVADARSRRGPR